MNIKKGNINFFFLLIYRGGPLLRWLSYKKNKNKNKL